MRRSLAPLSIAALIAVALGGGPTGCRAPNAEGIFRAQPAATTVKLDLYHKPLPEIPLPNDLATRYDRSSATGRRINASMLAPTGLERRTRRLADQLDGWGVFQQITIPFTGPLDVRSILAGHRDADYALGDDVMYLINVDRRSRNFGKMHHLDLGNGNYPVILKDADYWKNDPRGWNLSLTFNEENEDRNGNGILDPEEDTNADGVLELPNYLPGANPARADLAGRADALMTFYERATHTLIARPMVPLDERTTYAVVVTRRLLDQDGAPVGSPYPFINHTQQTTALEPLAEVLPEGLGLKDIAFAFTFTTQSIESDWIAVRDGLYGHGVQAHLGKKFPAEVSALEPLRERAYFPNIQNPYILATEDMIDALRDIAAEALNIDRNSGEFVALLESEKYIDFNVVGRFESPQLFPRLGSDGKLLPYDDQTWPPDLNRTPAPTRSETVYFWLTVPRKEVSARGQGRPAPVMILSHGYTSNRAEMLFYAGFFARWGFATMGIECPSHGLEVHPLQRAVIGGLFRNKGLEPFVKALFKDRAFDQNNDFKVDSGADFWTSYMFHTRDMVRQCALDYMQLIRMMRGFDGRTRWKLDVDGDGQPELAGDFDADGQIDIGGDAMITMTGGSLGGIMSTFVGGLEPEVAAVAPVAGGGGLSDIGIRSQQGGVREAVVLRMLAPIYVGTIDAATKKMIVETIVPDLTDSRTLKIATVEGVVPGDTLVAENLNNGERGCGYVDPEGRVRAAVQSDAGDRTRLLFYTGRALRLGSTDCEVAAGRSPLRVVDQFEEEVVFQQNPYRRGRSLEALADGLGLRRAHPTLRRFMSLAQLALDPADPAVFARHLDQEPLTYPGTGGVTGSHAVIITTVGDMNVPASSGVTVGRAAGFIDYLHPDRRYNKPINQLLLDTHTAEAVSTLKRYTDPSGAGVHLDVENFSQGRDMWGTDIPRLDPPLRLGFERRDRKGGISASIFPFAVPGGQHGFDFPGVMSDDAKKRCRERCTERVGTDPCGCSRLQSFDIGFFMFNMLGRYFASGGTVLDPSLCNSSNDCPDLPSAPAARDRARLP